MIQLCSNMMLAAPGAIKKGVSTRLQPLRDFLSDQVMYPFATS